MGIGFQQGAIVAQAVLAFNDAAVSTTAVGFLQVLGGSVFVLVDSRIRSIMMPLFERLSWDIITAAIRILGTIGIGWSVEWPKGEFKSTISP